VALLRTDTAAQLLQARGPGGVTAERLEWWVDYELPDIQLRGIIDRLEKDSDGAWILTDYKTGRVPGESRELSAFFGLRFYALVCWRAFGVIPKEIRLVYLSDPAVLTLNPHERMLIAFEKQITALGKAIN
jgi:putative RecB family exonuclease